MQTLSRLEKPNLSDSAAGIIREMIVDGELPEGKRINEVHLAEKLGISRTPLREALARLAAEGAITSRPRIGFVTCPLSLEEFEQIYPIRAILDPQALRLAGLPTPNQISHLETLNSRLEKTRNPALALAQDDAWHLELLAHCPNRVMVELIQQFMLRTRRYETALMRDHRNFERSLQDHRAILDACINGDLDAACVSLRTNMESGKEPIIAWLKERQYKK